MSEERILEKHLIIPALKILKDLNGATTKELRETLKQILKPMGENLAPLLNRPGDIKFNQIVRNLTGSHKKLVKMGFAQLNNQKYILTEKGEKLLIDKLEEYEYINSGYFTKKSQEQANEELLSNEQHKYFVPEDEISEGKLITTVTKTRKRSTKLREYAFDYYKKINQIKCDICGFNFEENYGKFGRDYIEFHHIKPISVYEEDGKIINLEEARQNLVPLCSNCHKILHRNRITVEQLKEAMNKSER